MGDPKNEEDSIEVLANWTNRIKKQNKYSVVV